MELTSPAFSPSSPIPKKYTGEGDDVSPPLQWKDVPEGTQAFALICEDPDAPRPEPWVHWLGANLDPKTRELAEGQPAGIEGMNDFGNKGYGGPMPPQGHGVHHYHFALYALNTELPVSSGMSKEEFEKTIAGNILEQAKLIGTYER